MKTFIVDAMLGKLAVWLRLTGYDTLYEPEVHDDELLEIAKRESRILLTSDYNLYERAQNRELDTLLVRGGVDNRIALVFSTFELNPNVDPRRARCSKCNGTLLEVTKAEKHKIENLVPEMTFANYDEFWWCQSCNSVFFQGGYWSNILKYMEKIKELMQKG